MEGKDVAMVSVASVETLVAHYVQIIKWLVVTLIISLCLMFGSFAITFFCSTEVVETQEFDADANGDGSYLIAGGDVAYGSESPYQNN